MTGLKLLFALILATIVGVTGWASTQVAMWETPRAVVTHPWFIATLTDTYLAFFTFWLWVAYREARVWRGLVWLVLIFVLGNIAMAAYVLLALWKLPRGAGIEALLLRPRA